MLCKPASQAALSVVRTNYRRFKVVPKTWRQRPCPLDLTILSLKHPFPRPGPTANFFLQLREVEKSHKSVKSRATARDSEDTAKDSFKNATQLQVTKAGKFYFTMITFHKSTWKGVKSICCEIRQIWDSNENFDDYWNGQIMERCVWMLTDLSMEGKK